MSTISQNIKRVRTKQGLTQDDLAKKADIKYSTLTKIEDDYGTSADGVILVLDVGVSETWLKDFEVPEIVKKMNFDGIYCFSSLIQNFIFPLKEINL